MRVAGNALPIAVAAVVWTLATPGFALADGGGTEEMEALEQQPARVLAQQAIAVLRVRGDQGEASMRVDAALESEDQKDVDVGLLEQADEAVDSGDVDGAISLLDRALSEPLGAATGLELHESGREYDPGGGSQGTVGIVLGASLLLLGLLLLRSSRRGALE